MHDMHAIRMCKLKHTPSGRQLAMLVVGNAMQKLQFFSAFV
jgi:hypothetical protein